MSKLETSDVAETSDSSIELQDSPPDPYVGGHTRRYRKVYGFFGFTRSYNFPLYVIFAGAMFGFSLSRLQDFNYDTVFSVDILPGYMYYFSTGTYRVGMILHLAGCLPAGLAMVLQFVPAVRHKFIFFHRVNGYFVLVLLLASNVGASIVLRHNDSGTRVSTQAAEAMLVILTTLGMAMAYWNIKRLQIDQHRAWMIRTMFLCGTIVTSRVLDNLASVIIARIGDYYEVWSCDQIDFTYKQFGVSGILAAKYPQCLIPNGTLDGRVVVKAVYELAAPEGLGASGAVPFGAALWIAIVTHVIGVEIYLSLTPRESARLRQVSYERQLAAGYKHPGNGGWTVDRFGDPVEVWKPKEV